MSTKRKKGQSLGSQREQSRALVPIAERKKAIATRSKKKKKEVKE